MDHSYQLAQFLRARRARVRPEDVGLQDIDWRRTPGLRREALAMLAGISAGYYMRLEQGRGHRPSEQVLQALARALRLDATPPPTCSRWAAPRARSSDRSWRQTRQSGPICKICWTPGPPPAFIHDRRLDVLASNPPVRALTPLSQPGTNLLRNEDFLARVGGEEFARGSSIPRTDSATTTWSSCSPKPSPTSAPPSAATPTTPTSRT